MKLTLEEKKQLSELIAQYGRVSQDFGEACVENGNIEELAILVQSTYRRILNLIYGDVKDAN